MTPLFNFGLSRGMHGIIIGPRRVETFGGWACTAWLADGRMFRVGVKRGSSHRIAYKPRGENIGFHWSGWVMDVDGRAVWSGRVPKSLGVRGLLEDSDVLPRPRCSQCRKVLVKGKTTICGSAYCTFQEQKRLAAEEEEDRLDAAEALRVEAEEPGSIPWEEVRRDLLKEPK